MTMKPNLSMKKSFQPTVELLTQGGPPMEGLLKAIAIHTGELIFKV